jgi:formylglycine-generating enzyme required for sulfatase activity
VARSAPGAVPQGYISGREAGSACGRSGKRLCSESEWGRACRGAGSTIYPWGNDRRDGVCNDARAVHPAVEFFGTGASWIWSRLGHPCINQLDDSVAATGSHPGCVSESGHFDLMGNLHEWTSDPAGTFRGGFYVDTVRNGAGCTYRTTAHDTGHWDYSTGFRCCADL